MRRLACVSLSAAALSATLLLSQSAMADMLEPVAGVKAMAGGSMFTTPSDRPGNDNYEGIGYAGNAGGFSCERARCPV